jgi:RHS repeat-associated protein
MLHIAVRLLLVFVLVGHSLFVQAQVTLIDTSNVLRFVRQLKPGTDSVTNAGAAVNLTQPAPPNLVPPTPEAASLGKFGNVPVAHYTGLPNIGIPLYTITQKDLALDLSLAYHAGGIRVEETAPWTGLGWALSGLGSITRTMRGNGPDELGVTGYMREQSTQYNLAQLYQWYQQGTNASQLNQFAGAYTDANDPIDTEADLFNFSMGKYSGKLVYDRATGTFLTVPRQDIQVNHDTDLTTWTLTTPDGTAWVFSARDQTTNVQNLCNATLPSRALLLTTSWHLTNIISATDPANVISISYRQETYTLRTAGSSSQKHVLGSTNANCQCNAGDSPNLNCGVETTYTASKPDQITFRNGYVQFVPQTSKRCDLAGSKALDKIVVYDAANTVVRQVQLSYTYAGAGGTCGTASYTGRLKLTQVRTAGASLPDAPPPYSFTYVNDGTLPLTTSYAQDFWGFYNGYTSNTTLMPALTIPDPIATNPPRNFPGANRDVNPTATPLCQLVAMSYPTGGRTEFEFESNVAFDLTTSQNRLAGGLRVKTITDYDQNGNAHTRRYRYAQSGSPTLSSGRLGAFPIYAYVGNLPNSIQSGACNNVECKGLFRSSESTYPLINTQGANVGYETVTVSYGAAGEGGYTVYQYTVPASVQTNERFPFVPPYMRDWREGLTTQTTSYSSTGRLIGQTDQTYLFAEFTPKTLFSSSFNLKLGYLIPGTFALNAYETPTDWFYQDFQQERVYHYNGVDFQETQRFMDHNNANLMLSETRLIDSYNDERKTTYTYPHDYPANGVYATMVQSTHQTGAVVEESESIQKAGTSGFSFLQKRLTNYGGFSPGFFAPQTVQTQQAGGPLITRLTYAYQGDALLSSYTERNGITTALSWHSTTGKRDLLQSVTVGAGTSVSQTSRYDYVPLVGLSSLTAANGQVSTWQYDGLSRLLSSRDPQGNLLQSLNYHFAGQPIPAGLMAGGLGTLSTAHNFVTTHTPRETQTSLSLDPAQTQTSIGYVDGLGRPIQSVGWQAGPLRADIIGSTTRYDALGRANLSWLATDAPDGTGTFRANADALAATFYDDVNPYSETSFEAAPTNRPLRQYGPGKNHRAADKYVELLYATHGQEISRYQLTGTGFKRISNYPVGSLTGEQMLTERGLYRIVVKDKLGRVVSRVEQGDSYLFTDYIYDDLGQLRYVLPPKAQQQFASATATGKSGAALLEAGSALWAMNAGPTSVTSVNDTDELLLEGIYAYRYDTQGRMTEKHVPGGGWQRIVYDKLDRPVLTQDDADGSEWSFTQYDALGRSVRTGRVGRGGTRQQAQDDFDSGLVTQPYEVRQSYGAQGYSNESFPYTYRPDTGSDEVKTVSYYDDYDWQTDVAFSFQPTNAFGQEQLTAVRGLATGSLIRNLETAAWYKAVNYYDYRGRIIQGFSQSVRGTTDRTDMAYRHNGEVLQICTQRAGLTEQTQYTYDHAGRKLAVDHQFGGLTARIATYTYDGIGRLKQKQLGDTGGGGNVLNVPNGQTVSIPANTTATHSRVLLGGRLQMGNPSTLRIGGGGVGTLLQAVDYSWHIRGGLRGLNLDGNQLQSGKLFAMQLDYEQDGIYYDGNIRQQTWRSATDGQERSYVYEYDGLSRLTFANFTGPNGEDFDVKDMAYDANGNLLTMKRLTGIDNLTYTYPAYSNKLARVTDATSNTVGFKDGTNPGDDYTYYDDGSLKSDANKGITSIEYNYLKLPKRVVIGSGSSQQTIDYEYDAAGMKLRKVVTGPGTFSSVTDYVGNQVWENGALYQVAYEEGRIVPEAGTYRYEWTLQDHLGNNRVSFADVNGVASVVQSQHYDPWGWELPTLGTAGSPVNRYKFLNREDQPETGLVDLMARQYDKILGRFWQLDPVTEGQEHLSLFQYGWNNPVLNKDPDGRMACCGTPIISQLHLAAKVESYISRANSRAGTTLYLTHKLTGKEPSFTDKVQAYASAYISGGAGSYTDQNDASVLLKGKNLDGSTATTGDKIAAGAGAALPLVGGKLIKDIVTKSGEGLAYVLKNTDIDLRGSGVKFNDALDAAFNATGVEKANFEVTKWGKDKYGKSVPVEYRASGGAEVSIDFPHTNQGLSPDAPHIGWQTPGKGRNQTVGHILLDQVPTGRSSRKSN